MRRDSPVRIKRCGLKDYTLRTGQLVALGPAEAFTFFEDPGNLAAITPPWLDFRIIGDCDGDVCRGAEYDYTIRWFGLTMPWRTRITEYNPGVSFTDSQVRGPYRSWVHRHTFVSLDEGTTKVVDEIQAGLRWHPLWGAVGLAMWLGLPLLFAYRGWKTRRLLKRRGNQ